jgi:hypothetical protein
MEQCGARKFHSAVSRIVRQIWSAQSGALSVGPHEISGGEGRPLISRCWPGLAPRRSPWGNTTGPLSLKGLGNGLRRLSNRPWTLSGNREPAPPELDPSEPRRRAPRWLERRTENAGIPKTLRVPALHREAECDTAGNIGRQQLVHTWNAPFVQGSVARRSHSTRFPGTVFKG